MCQVVTRSGYRYKSHKGSILALTALDLQHWLQARYNATRPYVILCAGDCGLVPAQWAAVCCATGRGVQHMAPLQASEELTQFVDSCC